MIAWGITHKGMVRQQNQDHYHLEVRQDQQIALLIVCDGMGGARAGNVASQLAIWTAVEELHQAGIRAHMNTKMMRQFFEQAVYRANRAVGDRARSSEEFFGMGTTLVGALVSDGIAMVANVGDSRAYLINQNGISRVTRDHSVVEDLVHRGDLSPDKVKNHPQKNLITRALGTGLEVVCDLYEVPLEAGDFLLLCSDGLTNMLDDQEILYEVIHGGNPDECCDRLVTLSNERGGLDNTTVILLSL